MLATLAAGLLLAPKVTAFVGARVLPVAGPEIPHGTVLIRDAKIVAVGPVDAVRVPPNARVIRAEGKTIVPGLVDTHSHIGGGAGGDGTGPIQPEARILDAIDVRSTGFRRAAAGGITTINIMPGSGHLVSGQTLYVKNRRARTIDDLFIRDREGWVMGGLKMANGTNPLGSPPFPGTRGKSMALVRERLLKAKAYAETRRRWEAKPAAERGDTPARDLGLEAIAEALAGKRVVHHHTHRADDIASVLRLQREFGFRLVLQHVSEGYLVADEIARAKVPCSVIVLDSPGGKLEAVNVDFANAARLAAAGVNVGLHTDDGITESRLFLRSAALAVRAGLAPDVALRSLTLAGAEMLGLEGSIGTLAPGRDADLVVLSGDPFSIYTQVLETWVEGERVFDRSDPKDRLVAVGGAGAFNERDAYLCCGGAR